MRDLSNVQVGDALVNELRWGKNVVYVEKLLPTQILIKNGGRYYKKNGHRVGYGDCYSTDYIRIAEEDEIQKIREFNFKTNVCNRAITVLDRKDISYEQAVKIKEILNL